MTPTPKCERCFGRGDGCLCPLVEPVETTSRVIIIRHALERGKQSNTARVAALALTRCELREFGARQEPLKAEDLGAPGTWLVYPGGSTAPPSLPPARLVVLDGSWSQARKMLQSIPLLATLPRLSLVPAPSRRSLRQAPPGGMSTLEAIARAVEVLDGPDRAALLDRLHAALVERVLRSRGYL